MIQSWLLVKLSRAYKKKQLGCFSSQVFRISSELLFAPQDEDADVSRQDQMSRLRKLHLPALCLNLHKVLDSSQMYVDAVQLADIIASEQHQLYKVDFRLTYLIQVVCIVKLVLQINSILSDSYKLIIFSINQTRQ